ncbi:MAG: hypothetical protein ACFFGP_08940 [Promethearchaeota archaeon]
MKHMVAQGIAEKEGIPLSVAKVMADEIVEQSKNTEKGKEELDELQKSFDNIFKEPKDKKK